LPAPLKKRATIDDLGLTKAEFAVLRRLSTPEKIQKYLLAMQQNFELDGDSCATVRMVLRDKRAHCIEGALVAAAALWIHGEPPLLLDLRPRPALARPNLPQPEGTRPLVPARVLQPPRPQVAARVFAALRLAPRKA